MRITQKNYQVVREKIVDAGLKATQQRIVIYHALSQMKVHPSAEKIYDAVKEENPSLSLGTVYKTLETLVTSGLVNKVLTDEGNMRYDANIDFHNHIYCTNTKEIIDYQNEELTEIITEFFNKQKVNNLLIKDIRLQINVEKIDPNKDIEIS